MKKTILLAALGLISLSALAQDKPQEEGFVFTTVKENPITSIKNQNRSSTCWSFSSLGFLESELLRTGKGEYDLSEMFVVHHTMVDRAVNYVRYHGDSSFSPGGSFYDIMFCMKNYGLVPQDAMPGIMYGDTLPVHNELDAVAGAYVNAIAKGKLTKLTPVWKNGLAAITLRDDDELIEVKLTDDKKDIILVTKDGMCIRFKETDVRSTGRTSMGVRGMNIDDGDEVVAMQLNSQGDYLLVVSENGMGKRTLISEFNAQIRGGKGVLCYKVTEKTGYLIGAKLVNDGREIMLITTEGIVIRMSVDDISVIGRNTSGVKLMNIDQESDIKVASIAKVRESATRDNEAEEEELEEAEDNTAETEENDTEE